MSRASLSVVVFAAAGLTLSACQNRKPLPFTESMVLGGEEVSAERLNTGYQTYMRYCYACHGEQGDGNGPAAYSLRPPPRDLRSGTYKFGGVVEGLPYDEDLQRIIQGGLAGTAMLPWEMSVTPKDGVIQYIKTFAEVWQDPDEEYGDQVFPEDDPWADDVKAGIERGSAVYHGFATCQSCHPAYLTKQAIYDASTEWNKNITEFRKHIYKPELKEAQGIIVTRWNSDPPEEHTIKILPPDFLYHQVRSARPGTEVEDLYRTIGAGIPGTAMPAWYGSIEDADLWAMAYYVKSLMDLRGKPAAYKMREALRSQPAFVAPEKKEAPPAEEAPAEEDAKPAEEEKPADEGKADDAKADEGKADEGKADEGKADAKADDAKADAKAETKADDEKKADGKADAKSPGE